MAGQASEQSYFAKVDNKQWTSNGKLYRIFKTCIEFKLECDQALYKTIVHLKFDDENLLKRPIEQLLKQTITMAKNNQSALLMLSGAKLDLVNNLQDTKLEVRLPHDSSISIDNRFTWYKGEHMLESFNRLKTFNSGVEQMHVRANIDADTLRLESTLSWQEKTIRLNQNIQKKVFDGVYLTSSVEKNNNEVTVIANLTGPYSGDTTGVIEFELLPNLEQGSGKNNNYKDDQKVELSPYEYKSWQQTFLLPEQSNQPIAIEIKAKLQVDGEGVLLSEFINLN